MADRVAQQGTPPLKWTPGDDVANVKSLIEVSTANLLSLVPEAADARYDFATGTFRDAEGQPLDDEVLRGWASDVRGMRTTRTGRNTIKRGILLNTLARTESGQRPGTLEQALRQPRQLVARGLKDTFYQPDGSGARGSITFPREGVLSGETVINLFGSANLSTFLHESGHLFVEVTDALAADPAAPQALRDDMDAIRRFVGNDGGPLTRPQHETFAPAFEAYLMEGKAPSLALADALARFKAWLTRIYRSIAGRNVRITPGRREVTDRMPAFDAAVTAVNRVPFMPADQRNWTAHTSPPRPDPPPHLPERYAMTFAEDLDAVGLLCPLPVLKARKRLMALPPGAVLRLRASDPAAHVDVPHFCAEAGHSLLATEDEGAVTAYFIQRGDPA